MEEGARRRTHEKKRLAPSCAFVKAGFHARTLLFQRRAQDTARCGTTQIATRLAARCRVQSDFARALDGLPLEYGDRQLELFDIELRVG